ncbi:unnamed protein product [Heligmosomoides polygyrus]|uniref:Neur_chan_LBD domain-containing protein n=1 Tax=Heligmosomoides polygyrus TaxID=6339 RepID=A0A183F2K6_HELPZ|nr:unnamed protein product [Heligmosomoides polygyrus]
MVWRPDVLPYDWFLGLLSQPLSKFFCQQSFALPCSLFHSNRNYSFVRRTRNTVATLYINARFTVIVRYAYTISIPSIFQVSSNGDMSFYSTSVITTVCPIDVRSFGVLVPLLLDFHISFSLLTVSLLLFLVLCLRSTRCQTYAPATHWIRSKIFEYLDG